MASLPTGGLNYLLSGIYLYVFCSKTINGKPTFLRKKQDFNKQSNSLNTCFFYETQIWKLGRQETAAICCEPRLLVSSYHLQT